MPNQPKTPVRSYRLSDETVAQLDKIKEAFSTTHSDAVRRAIDAFSQFTSLALPLEAYAAAEEAAWLNVHMPGGEAERRLVAALDAATPYIAAVERKRTLEDVVTRLEGFQVDPAVVQHFRSLADHADR